MDFRSICLACARIGAVVAAGSALAANPVSKEVEVNGVMMPFVDQGAGDPILLVHGAVSDLRAWEPTRGEIADEHRFIAITLRYFGTGDWPDGGGKFSVATHASDLAAFIKALDVGPVHLVGWSYGANVATAAALQNPELVQSLILFEPALTSLVKEGEPGDAAREALGKMFGPVTVAVQQGDLQKATRLLIEGVFQLPPGGFDNQPQDLRAMQLDNARTMGLLWSAAEFRVTCDMLRSLDRPTLIIHGAESNAYWPHVAQAMDECLPQAEIGVQPNVNHDGPVRAPAGFAAIVEDFVVKH
ncbi:alpha/beta hydrolase [Inquilinus limosus]|uniref:alpha/beta fold hydrolase n=1 Tax=Inquilinus limosus TaxID=171674 RepID=UPI003F173216